MPRLILDTSTIARWAGPPVGIVRVERELALHALTRRPDVVLAFHDKTRGGLRELAPRWRSLLLSLDGAIDTIAVDYRRDRPLWRNLLSARYPLVMALERQRLMGRPPLARLAARAQHALLGAEGRRPPFGDARGQRNAVIPHEEALGPMIALEPGDTVLSAGSDWLHKGTALLEAQRQYGFRLAVLCYDLIPLTHPEFFQPREIQPFREYWRAVLPAAARVLCNARCIARDIEAFAASNGLGPVTPAVVPLGYAPRPIETMPPLPAPLRPGGFALFVSTIEPRKGHAVLLEAWRALRTAGIPQRRDFRLVFIGRMGWNVEDVGRQLAGGAFGDSVLHWEGIGDDVLARLYQDAAFCLYPSRYEGFGLPIIEAFAHGKAVIASTGGAVPETVAGLSPCLDPLDTEAWTSLMGDWIEHPEAAAPWEERIARLFHYTPWPDAAEGIMRAAVADG